MEIVKEKISMDRLHDMAQNMFGDIVKAVVDVKRKVMAVDAELHADEETLLLDDGSNQNDIWGINLYPDMGIDEPDFIEFDSMINLRPSQNNMSRGVDDPAIRESITTIVKELIVL